MQTSSNSHTDSGLRRDARARYVVRALVALLIFIAWTAVVRVGISGGSRHTVWSTRAFGTWPDTIRALDGSNNMELSIRATFGTGEVLGSSSTGREPDFGDPANINGSRFVTGSEAGRVQSMSAYVAAPVDAAPFNQFELAIYEDHRGAPGRLVAHSARGSLTADAWNTVAIDALLSPRTPYWLVYNSNGRADGVNNLTLAPLVTDPLDAVIRSPRSNRVKNVASALMLIGSPAASALLLIALSLWIGADSPRLLGWMWAGFCAGGALEFALKQTLFFPYASYPSGHALRAVFVATIAVAVSRSRPVRVIVPILTVLVSLGAVHPNRHYSEEVLGGALAGWGLAAAALGCGLSRAHGLESWPRADAGAGAFVRRGGIDRRRRERRTQPEPVDAL